MSDVEAWRVVFI